MFFRSVLVVLLSLLPWVGAVAQEPGAAAVLPPLQKLILADNEARALGIPEDYPGQVVVGEVPLLATQEFATLMGQFLGQRVSFDLVNTIGAAVRQYGIAKDRVINLVLPTQDSTRGVLRLVVVIGTYRDIQIRGNRWFSARMLEQKLGIKPGDEISISRLDEAVNWANTNPFRRVQVLLNPVQEVPGKSDLIVGVDERIPARFTASFDDTGNEVIGKNHYTGMLQYGNLFGLDHQFTYQLITTDHSKVYLGHALDYRIPLKWRHYLQLSGNYSKARPSFSGGLFQQDATNVASALRYTVPVRGGDNPVEWFGLLDFKESNNNLLYGGTQVIASKTDLFHLGTGFSAVKRDARGAWVAGVNLMLSPGGINSRNTTEALRAARLGASAAYLYGNVSLQRLTKFDQGWDLFTRVYGQLATDNMLGSEQLTIGGSTTVRGYEERIYAAEQGFVFSNELMMPAWKKTLPGFFKRLPPLEGRLTAFYDVAYTSYKHRYETDIEFTTLASAGLGCRMTLANNFSFSFDYGWQLRSVPYAQPSHRRGHLKFSLSY